MSRTDDVLALTELSYRYFRAVEARDGAAISEIFAPDATLDYGSPDLQFEDLASFLVRFSKGVGQGRKVACFSNHLFDIDESTARGTWNGIVLHVDPDLSDGTTLMIGNVYRVEAARFPEWRFTAMAERPVWTKGNPKVVGDIYTADER